jgi:hypothetical protein
MSMQPALDQITMQALRLGRDPNAGTYSWSEDGRGVWIFLTYPDGTELKGFAPNGMDEIDASIAALGGRH